MRAFLLQKLGVIKNRENQLGGAVFIILFVMVMLPLLSVIIQVVFPGIFFGERVLGDLSLLLDVFRRPLWRVSLQNSVLLGVGTMVFGTLLGGGMATLRSHWVFPGAKLLDIAAWLLLITPSFVLAQGWVMFSASSGIASVWLNAPWVNSFVFSTPGLIFVMVFSKFPLAYITIRAAQEWKVDRFSEAARMNGASAWTVWRTVEAPLLLPAYCAAAALVFMDTIGDFGLPASLAPVFNFPTLPYTIYTAIYTFPVRFDMAGVLSLYLVLLIAGAMSLQFLAMRKSRFDFMTSRATRLEPAKLPKKKTAVLTVINLAVLLISLGVPMGSNALLSISDVTTVANINAFTLDNYRNLFADNPILLEGLRNSIQVAAVTALIGLVVGFFSSYVLTYTKVRFKRAIDVMSLTSLAVPGIVLGIGYIFVWNQPWLARLGLGLIGTPSILIMASVAGAIPVITRVLTGGMAKVPSQLLQAAQIQGAGFWQRLATILIPLSKGTVVSAGSAAFGSSVFNLALATMLFPRNFMLLPFAVRRPYATLNFGTAAASTLFSAAVVVGVILVIEVIFKRNILSKIKLKSILSLFRSTGERQLVCKGVHNSFAMVAKHKQGD